MVSMHAWFACMFHKVVQKPIYGVMGYIIITLLRNVRRKVCQ